MPSAASNFRPLWIKICATTNLPDALLAADLGADAIGFVFAPSPRQVTAEQVAAITSSLPPTIERVGVFLGSTADDLSTISLAARKAGLTAIQLHGGIDIPFASALQELLGPAISIIHTAHWSLSHDPLKSAEGVSTQLSMIGPATSARVLIDAKVGSQSGGLGVSFDWPSAKQAFHSYPSLRMIVAGGLRPDNVAEAIVQLNPYGIDVASGIEQTPGKKDPEKTKAFMQRARAAI